MYFCTNLVGTLGSAGRLLAGVQRRSGLPRAGTNLPEGEEVNPALSEVWTHMRELGLGALAHANRHAAYSGDNARWPELSVLQAAHAAELLIKARIAEEHPLLIFEELPGATKAAGPMLDVQDLFKYGRTLQWTNLPGRLWAATGLEIPNRECFDNFGRLRNGLQHFGPAGDVDAGSETLRFVFKVIDPFIKRVLEALCRRLRRGPRALRLFRRRARPSGDPVPRVPRGRGVLRRLGR